MVRPHYTVFSQFVMTLGAVLQVLLSPVLGGGLPRNDPTSIYQLYTLLSLVVFAAGVVLAALDKQTRWGTARKRKRAVRERARSTEALVAFFSYVVAGVFAHLMHQPYCHHWAAYCSNEALVATVVQPSQSDAAYECQCSWPLRALGVRGNGPVLPILAALEAHKGVLADAHAPEGKKAKYRCLLGLVVRMNGSEAEAAVTTIRSWKLAPWSQTVANSSGDFVQRECRRQ
jgi:hypothetical protein